jgi:acetyl-CoA synthetase
MKKESNPLPFDSFMNPGVGRYAKTYKESLETPDKFFEEAGFLLDWYSKWDKVLDKSKEPYYRWYVNGKLNLSYNALDRHSSGSRRNKAAFIWVNEKGDEKIVTYNGLYNRVNSFSRALLDMGIRKGDRIAIYLPMIIEEPVAMLAAARIGAVFTVIFSGFGAEAIAERVNDCGAKMIITADGGYRRGKFIPLKETVDRAIELTTTVETVIVVKHTNHETNMVEGRDYWYHDLLEVKNYVEPERMDSNDPLFILYTSGTTGKPKGVVHGTGGYGVWVTNTLKWAFDPKENDRWWCAADIGWITGHSYIVFAPLILGLTSILYEGSFDYPSPDQMWKIISYYEVDILYTSPTAIRALMKYGDEYPRSHDLSSLRVLGTVGEPINPAAWQWYYERIGSSQCPIVDTYWQTETGGFVVSPALGIGYGPLKPGSATLPLPGIDPVIMNSDGKEAKAGEKGLLYLKRPWPGLMLELNNADEKYRTMYFGNAKKYYFTGDYAIKDKDGFYWLLGRADEVLKISGHRIGTIEVEDALLSTGVIAEAGVFGKPHQIKGESIVSFVVLKSGVNLDSSVEAIKNKVRDNFGPLLIPDEIHIVGSLPKTRSGKIMRRIMKAVYQNQVPGDISTLESGASLEEIKESIEKFRKELKTVDLAHS